MVTAAAVAHANRLPVLLIAGDTYVNRLPDPVLQQVEHFGAPSTTVNDSFKAVSRYWDRIVHPAQIIQSLPQAVAMMLDPADCGPAFIAIPQDTQELAYDYPLEFFEEKTWVIPRPRPALAQIAAAVEVLSKAKKPLIISGGGVRYSGAEDALAAFAKKRGIPMAETIAGKGAVCMIMPSMLAPWALKAPKPPVIVRNRRMWCLPSAHACRILLRVHGRLSPKMRALSISMPRALMRLSIARLQWWGCVGIAQCAGCGTWHLTAPPARMSEAQAWYKEWNALVDAGQAPTNQQYPSYAQVVGVVNRMAKPEDVMVTAAGGLPGETIKNWRCKSPHSFDCEFGYSCMGYEIAGGWGHALALQGKAGGKAGTPIVMVGDGSYMMMNSDIHSSVISGLKMIVIVCDNGGFAVINRLQTGMGGVGFNNLLKDSRVVDGENVPHVDFAKHAEAMGAAARHVENLAELEEALAWAETTDRTTVISIATDAYSWTPGGADWYVGVPEISPRKSVVKARKTQETFRKKQRIGI